MKQVNLGRLTLQGTVHRAAPSYPATHCRTLLTLTSSHSPAFSFEDLPC